MEKVIVIRYAEIHLKGRNIAFFETKLKKNIKNALAGIKHDFKAIRCRYIVSNFDEVDEFEICEKLSKVCGIHSFSVASVIPTDIAKIKETALEMINFTGTFKVETNRADKTLKQTSVDISREVGGYLLDKAEGLKVDVRNPENIVHIDIREGGKTFVFAKFQKGVGGLPCGVSGNGVLLLSGGIDSPVAGYMMAKRGMNVNCLNFFSYPYTSDMAKEKVVSLAKIMRGYNDRMTLTICGFTEIQEAIHKNCDGDYMIAIMRRFMMRIADRFTKITHSQAIITGENLGQVASQTVESMTCTNAVIQIPVFRPVIGFDKSEIIEIAQKIGTFETSILPYEDCCTVFLPKNPVIRPSIEQLEAEEAKLDVEGLVERALEKLEIIKLKD
ncbi:MAG: tRNA uracil 4-sulfurtransferase ThiI [Bacillota bacterium]